MNPCLKKYGVLFLLLFVLVISGCKGDPLFSQKVLVGETFSTESFYSEEVFSLQTSKSPDSSLIDKIFIKSDVIDLKFSDVYGISVSGEANLENAASYARVVAVSGEEEILVYSATSYPKSEKIFGFSGACEESCILDGSDVDYFKIEINDASLDVYSFNIVEDKNDLGQEIKSKSISVAKDELNVLQSEAKIMKFNEYNSFSGDHWVAGETGVGKLSYSEKKKLFFNSLSDGGEFVPSFDLELPNIGGYFYYKGGFYEFPSSTSVGDEEIPLNVYTSSGSYSFDWRDKHGARDPDSPYYDSPVGDEPADGWLTSIKDQGGCGSCWSFAIMGAIEAMVNIVSNTHLNLDLSEQYPMGCCGVCGGCGGGNFHPSWYSDEGSIPEWCFPYQGTDSFCTPCAEAEENKWKISNNPGENYVVENNYYLLKERLVEAGPLMLTQRFRGGMSAHMMLLVGFGNVVPGNYTHPLGGLDVIPENDPLVGTTYWTIKNQYGLDWGEEGYGKIVYNNEWELKGKNIMVPIYGPDDVALVGACQDEDMDGYCNWGFASLEKPVSGCPASCVDNNIMDCDDSDSGINQCPSIEEMVCGSDSPYLLSREPFEFGANSGTEINYYYPSYSFYLEEDCCGDQLGEYVVEGSCCNAPDKQICDREVLQYSFKFGDEFVEKPADIFALNGELFVLYNEVNESKIRVFDTSGNLLRDFSSFGYLDGQLHSPVGMDTDGEKIYVVDKGANRISVFNVNGSFIGWMGKCTSGANCDVENERSVGFSCDGLGCCADHISGDIYEAKLAFDMCPKGGLKCNDMAAENYCAALGFDNFVVGGYTCRCPPGEDCERGNWANNPGDPWHGYCSDGGTPVSWIDSLRCMGPGENVNCIGLSGGEGGQFDQVNDVLVDGNKLYVVDGVAYGSGNKIQVFDLSLGGEFIEYFSLPLTNVDPNNYKTLSLKDENLYVISTNFDDDCYILNLENDTWSECTGESEDLNRIIFDDDGAWYLYDEVLYYYDNFGERTILLGGLFGGGLSFDSALSATTFGDNLYVVDPENSAILAFEPQLGGVCGYSPEIAINPLSSWPLFEEINFNAEVHICGDQSDSCDGCNYNWTINDSIVSNSNNYSAFFDYNDVGGFSMNLDVSAPNGHANNLEVEVYPGFIDSFDFPLSNESLIFYYEGEIYVADGIVVSVLDSVDGSLLRSFGSYGMGDSQFVSISSLVVFDDFIYVSDRLNHRINKFDVGGSFVGWMGRCTSGSNCDVANERSVGFSCTDETCSGLYTGEGEGQFTYPNYMDLSNGKVYVYDGLEALDNDYRVQTIDLGLEQVTNSIILFMEASSLAVDGDYIYFGMGACTVLKVDQSGEFLLALNGCDVPGQYSVTCTPQEVGGISVGNGFVFVTNPDKNMVIQFTQEGEFVSFYGTDEFCLVYPGIGNLNYPSGIHLNDVSELYVADSGNDKIKKFGYFLGSGCGDGVCEVENGETCSNCADCYGERADCESGEICNFGYCEPGVLDPCIDYDGDNYSVNSSEDNCDGFGLQGYGDCDDNNSELFRLVDFYLDEDHDLFGTGNVTFIDCWGEGGYFVYPRDEMAFNNEDCDDLNPDVWYLQEFYLDEDHDLYGIGEVIHVECWGEGGIYEYPKDEMAFNNEDCDDLNPDVNPGAGEDCQNSIDDNCNEIVNDGCPRPTPYKPTREFLQRADNDPRLSFTLSFFEIIWNFLFR